MTFICRILDQKVVDDLLAVEARGVKGFVHKHFSKYLLASSEHLIDVQQSIKKNDFISARETVHKLGGLSGTLGVLTVHRLCHSMEIKLSNERIVDLRDDVDNLSRLLEEAKGEVESLIAVFR